MYISMLTEHYFDSSLDKFKHIKLDILLVAQLFLAVSNF